MNKETAELVSFVLKAKNSQKILALLVAEGDYSPTQIQKKTNLHLSNISRTLTDLEKKKLISCINPDSSIKFYIATKKGKEINELVKKYKKTD
jgi:DNA-binding MarR family transcriptional regulator